MKMECALRRMSAGATKDLKETNALYKVVMSHFHIYSMGAGKWAQLFV